MCPSHGLACHQDLRARPNTNHRPKQLLFVSIQSADYKAANRPACSLFRRRTTVKTVFYQTLQFTYARHEFRTFDHLEKSGRRLPFTLSSPHARIPGRIVGSDLIAQKSKFHIVSAVGFSIAVHTGMLPMIVWAVVKCRGPYRNKISGRKHIDVS